MPVPSPAPPRPARKPFKLSRRLIILISVLGLLIAGGAAGALVLTNILRGGADSPEQAVTNSLDAVTKKDLVGLFSMVSPHEREALLRVKDAFVKKAKDEQIAEAAKSVALHDSGQGGSELAFDGVDVTFTGISPTVSQVSEDVAVVHISSGEIKLHVDPAQTKGAIRSLFDTVEKVEPTDQTWNISDLGPSRSGLSVLASKKDGRWYVNLAMSALEAVNSYQGTPRGVIPVSSQTGSDNPQTAAKAAVEASQTQSASQMAPFLVKDEANVFYLYGHLWDKVNTGSSFHFSFGNVDFAEGPHDGNRAQAYVNQINVNTASEDRFTFTDKCINNSSSGGEGVCLNGSAYQAGGYGAGINWMSILAHDGKFALTTVDEDGKWKLSLLDTAADHVVSALNSLSHEQSLALSGLAHSIPSSGALGLGQSNNIEFNSAGYAVATLKMDKAAKLQLDKQSTLNKVSVYSGDGKKDFGDIWSYGSNATTFEAGEYKVVAWGGSKVSEAFRKDGNSAKVSEAVTISEYVEPATIDGSNASRSVSVSSQESTLSLNVPTASAGALLVKIETPPNSGSKIVAILDGQSYQVDPTDGKVTGIPVGVGSHTLSLVTQSDSSKDQYYFYDYAYVDLSFENQ